MSHCKLVLAYVPVLHQGYWNFFREHADIDEICILGGDLIEQFPQLAKNLPALSPDLIATAIQSWKIVRKVTICDFPRLEELFNSPPNLIVAPDEDVTRSLIQDFLPNCTVEYSSIFLRRDKHNTLAQQAVVPELSVSTTEFDRDIITQVDKESEKSSDFWRRVGAAIVKQGEIVLLTHNHHVPSQQTPYAFGDPRGNFKKGIHIELSTAIHAEAALIAEAAKRGISLNGADIYVATFPCPPCAKLIAYSGIQRLFFREGYSMLDGHSILTDNHVEIILVT